MVKLPAVTKRVPAETQILFSELTMPVMGALNTAGSAPLIVNEKGLIAILDLLGRLPGGETATANEIVAFRKAQLEGVISTLPEKLKPSKV